jgi:hypothetical protein
VPGREGFLGQSVRFDEQGDHGVGPLGERRGLPDGFEVSDEVGAALGVNGPAHAVIGGEPVMDDRARVVGEDTDVFESGPTPARTHNQQSQQPGGEGVNPLFGGLDPGAGLIRANNRLGGEGGLSVRS